MYVNAEKQKKKKPTICNTKPGHILPENAQTNPQLFLLRKIQQEKDEKKKKKQKQLTPKCYKME